MQAGTQFLQAMVALTKLEPGLPTKMSRGDIFVGFEKFPLLTCKRSTALTTIQIALIGLVR